MKWNSVITLLTLVLQLKYISSVRLHKLFQILEGHNSEHGLDGFLHVGNDYSVYLKAPQPHSRTLVYELYETKNSKGFKTDKPRLLAISIVPVDYIKDQLKTYNNELYLAKYVDGNAVPGTRVATLREWQIDRSPNFLNALSKDNAEK